MGIEIEGDRGLEKKTALVDVLDSVRRIIKEISVTESLKEIKLCRQILELRLDRLVPLIPKLISPKQE